MSTHNMPFLNMKKKINLNYPQTADMGFFSEEIQHIMVHDLTTQHIMVYDLTISKVFRYVIC